jgi:flagellar hook-basal body complex protein FliE
MDITNVQGVRSDISEMLSKIKELSTRSNTFSHANPAQSVASTNHFEGVLNIAKEAVSNISHSQQTTEQLRDSFLSGDKSVTMSQVIVSSEKSKLAFEGLIAVRNKIIESYKDIMSMNI